MVAGKVLDIAYLGNISTYHVELPDGERHGQGADRQQSPDIAQRDITWEDDVWLSWSDTAGIVLAN